MYISGQNLLKMGNFLLRDSEASALIFSCTCRLFSIIYNMYSYCTAVALHCFYGAAIVSTKTILRTFPVKLYSQKYASLGYEPSCFIIPPSLFYTVPNNLLIFWLNGSWNNFALDTWPFPSPLFIPHNYSLPSLSLYLPKIQL